MIDELILYNYILSCYQLINTINIGGTPEEVVLRPTKRVEQKTSKCIICISILQCNGDKCYPHGFLYL